jgi:hypothetical protein
MSILSDRLLKECLERVSQLESRLDAMEMPHHARLLIADQSLLEQTNFGAGVPETIPPAKRRGRPRKNAYG